MFSFLIKFIRIVELNTEESCGRILRGKIAWHRPFYPTKNYGLKAGVNNAKNQAIFALKERKMGACIFLTSALSLVFFYCLFYYLKQKSTLRS